MHARERINTWAYYTFRFEKKKKNCVRANVFDAFESHCGFCALHTQKIIKKKKRFYFPIFDSYSYPFFVCVCVCVYCNQFQMKWAAPYCWTRFRDSVLKTQIKWDEANYPFSVSMYSCRHSNRFLILYKQKEENKRTCCYMAVVSSYTQHTRKTESIWENWDWRLCNVWPGLVSSVRPLRNDPI